MVDIRHFDRFQTKIAIGSAIKCWQGSTTLPKLGITRFCFILKKWFLKYSSKASVIGTSASVLISSIFLFFAASLSYLFLISGTYLAKYLSERSNRYTYRFCFAPETIGAITYISKNINRIKDFDYKGSFWPELIYVEFSSLKKEEYTINYPDSKETSIQHHLCWSIPFICHIDSGKNININKKNNYLVISQNRKIK